jgi:hypothetical protein
MKIKAITTKKNYKAYLKVVSELVGLKIKPGSAEYEKLQTALVLIKNYEDKH